MSITYRMYDLYPESILIRDFEGLVSVNEIIDSWECLLKNEQISSSVKGIINNTTHCNLQMDFDSFETLMTYLKSNEIFKRVKLAVLCIDSKTTIFPTIAEKKEHTIKIKPFSTMEAATHWIMVG